MNFAKELHFLGQKCVFVQKCKTQQQQNKQSNIKTIAGEGN